MSLKLYAPLGNFRANKIIVAARFADVPLEPHYVTYKSIKDKEFLKKNPLGKVPVLETSEGHIFESHAILRHIARLHKEKGLYGSSDHESSLVDQWLDFCNFELDPEMLSIMLPIFGWAPHDKEREKESRNKINNLVKILDNHLKMNNYLVGNQLTIADIAIAITLLGLFRTIFEEKYRNAIPNLTRWFEQVVSTEPFKRSFGKVRLCVKEFEPAHGEAKHEGKKEESKKETKPKQEKHEHKK
jgi:elongation factor 1-gamma